MIISIEILINGVVMPLRLTTQAFSDGAWRDAATLTVENPERVADGRCLVAYDGDYIIANVDRMEDRCELALSVNLPLNWDHHDVKGYPAFLYDIIPSGAAKDSLESRYGRLKPEGVEMGLYLRALHAAPCWASAHQGVGGRPSAGSERGFRAC
ncbi:hypothetical protein [Pseudomonas sp. Leaf58]|uniref:hypothetical protein n=1 Tax=Pseudomonas sp. Leaf58 TaxID=1736226 RepID=UPI001F34C4AD|nr:hypothetical protein [Pseudomonas sp. Leaf58]